MGFALGLFGNVITQQKGRKATPSVELLHKAECSACPLHLMKGLKHPKLEPAGSESPLVYMLGEMPDRDDDQLGEHFAGEAGDLLRLRIPTEFENDIRWNYIVRTKAKEPRPPTITEMECCRPSIIRDIEATKPVAIFGFGAAVLDWAIQATGIGKWRGRRGPIKVGNHTCWFFPMLNPQEVLDGRKWTPRSPKEYGSDNEFAFVNDLRQAFALVSDLPDPIVHTREQALDGIEIIMGDRGMADVKRVQWWLQELAKEKVVGLDYETNRLRPYAHLLADDPKDIKILSVALSAQWGAVSFPFRHREAKWSAAHLALVEQAYEAFLYDAPCRKVVHQLGFEMEWSAQFFGPDCLRATPWEDTISQAYLLDCRQGTLSLDFLCLEHFGLNIKDISALDRKRLDEEPLERVLSYNAVDAKYHRHLYFVQKHRLREHGLEEVYAHQIRRVPTLVLTQMKGVPIDQSVIAGFADKYGKQVAKVEQLIFAHPSVQKFKRIYGQEFRPSANEDVRKLIIKVLGIPIESTDEKNLKLANHEVADLIVRWRKPAKMVSTYITPVMADSPHVYRGGLLHPIISTTKVSTWRTSSEDPNSQNWPHRGPGAEIRGCIKPRSGYKICAFDYAGIQGRNVAMESLDTNLVKSFWNRYDIHSDWLERLIRIYPTYIKEGVKSVADQKGKLWKAYRSVMKNSFVFPSFFGAQPRSIAINLSIPEDKAVDLHAEFWDEFPEIKNWHKIMKRDYFRTGYVTGLSGFRRRAPISANELINAPIQSDESIIVLGAMIRLSEMEDWRFQANMEIHDDLTFIWQASEVEKNAEVVIKEMTRIVHPWINVPLEVEFLVGDDWCELNAVGAYESLADGGYKQL